jgi:serine/threonine protein kinase
VGVLVLVGIASLSAQTRQIAEAIHYLHRENYVHRDIKLQNVLVAKEWQCLVSRLCS